MSEAMRISDQEVTRLRVLKILRRTQPIARTRLASLCGLTGTTITEIVSDLVRRGLVVEEKVATGARGRPRIDLSINSRGGHVIAAYTDWRGGVAVEIVDLSGHSVFSYSAPVPGTRSLEVRARETAEILAAAIDAGPVPKASISNAAVTLPAVIDSRNGQVIHFETHNRGPFPFADIIERRLNIPTTIESNVSGLARAEHWFGDGADQEDLITIFFGLGLSAAHYREGFVSTGVHGLNPELGHLKIVADDSRLCVCGARGCLQTYSSISAIIRQVNERGSDPPVPFPFLEWEAPIRGYIASAVAGEGPAREVIEEAGRYLGISISNLVNFCDPHRIVVIFEEPGLIDLVSGPLHKALDSYVLHVLRGRTAIELKGLNNNHLWRGSAAMALEQFYRTR